MSIYTTDKARKAHIKNIDRLREKLGNSEDCLKGLGYCDLREVARYLLDLKKATENEMLFK